MYNEHVGLIFNISSLSFRASTNQDGDSVICNVITVKAIVFSKKTDDYLFDNLYA